MEAGRGHGLKDALQHGNSFMAPPIQSNEFTVTLGPYLAIEETDGFMHPREPSAGDFARGSEETPRLCCGRQSSQVVLPERGGEGEARGEDGGVGRSHYGLLRNVTQRLDWIHVPLL